MRRQETGVGRQPVPRHRRRMAVVALDRRRRGVAEQPDDAAMALGDEMIDQQPGGFRVVDSHDVLRPRRPGAVDQHDGEVEVHRAELLRHRARRRVDEPGDSLFLHQAQVHRLARRVLVGVAQHDPHVGAIGGVLHRPAEGGEERIADVGDDQPDGARSAASAAAAPRDWAIAGRLHRRLDLLLEIGADRSVGEHARHGRRRDARHAGDVLDPDGHFRKRSQLIALQAS